MGIRGEVRQTLKKNCKARKGVQRYPCCTCCKTFNEWNDSLSYMHVGERNPGNLPKNAKSLILQVDSFSENMSH